MITAQQGTERAHQLMECRFGFGLRWTPGSMELMEGGAIWSPPGHWPG